MGLEILGVERVTFKIREASSFLEEEQENGLGVCGNSSNVPKKPCARKSRFRI